MAKEQRIFVLKQWWISGGTTQTINETFQHEFSDDEIQASQTIYRLVKKFDETDSVEDAPRSRRPKSVKTDKNMQIVSQSFFFLSHKHHKDVKIFLSFYYIVFFDI